MTRHGTVAGLLITASSTGEGVVTVSVAGELDVVSVPLFRFRVAELGEDVRHIDFEVDRLDFVDSTGLGALVGAHKRLCARGGDGVRIVAPQPRLRRMLQVTGLDRILDVV